MVPVGAPLTLHDLYIHFLCRYKSSVRVLCHSNLATYVEHQAPFWQKHDVQIDTGARHSPRTPQNLQQTIIHCTDMIDTYWYCNHTNIFFLFLHVVNGQLAAAWHADMPPLWNSVSFWLPQAPRCCRCHFPLLRSSFFVESLVSFALFFEHYSLLGMNWCLHLKLWVFSISFIHFT